EQHLGNLTGDRQLHSVALGERHRRARRVHPFRHGREARQHVIQPPSPPELHTERAVARLRAGGREDQIAHPRQARERQGPCRPASEPPWPRPPATAARGWRTYPSRPNDGPDSAAMGTPGGSTSPSTHDSVVSRSGSSPFDTLTTRAPPRSAGPARAMTSRT